MRFSTDAKTLKAALRTMKSVIYKRSSMPILACVRIEASAEGISIVTTDLEVGLILTFPFDVFDVFGVSGVTVVPFKALESTLKAYKGIVTLDTQGTRETLRVENETSSVRLATSPPNEYPTMPAIEAIGETQSLTSLREAFGAVSYAASSNPTRHNLNGIAVEVNPKGSTRCIATDGHRLAIANAGAISLPWEGIRILPLKPLKLLGKLLKGAFDCARVDCDQSSVSFRGEGFTLSIRCIEGEYPNYNQVIPERIVETISVDRDALLDGLASVEHCAPGRSRAVKIKLDSGIGLETSNPDIGDASAHVAAVRGRGESDVDKVFCLNLNYLHDALTTFEPGDIAIGIKGNAMVSQMPDYACSPIQLTHAGDAYPLCVVMPMRS